MGHRELAKALGRYGYEITRQTGSHVRLTTRMNGEHHLTVPSHQPIRVGTLSAVLAEVANPFGVDKATMAADLWE